MGKAGHLALCIGEKKVHVMLWLENWQEGDHFEDLGIDGSVILKLLLNIWWKYYYYIYLLMHSINKCNACP